MKKEKGKIVEEEEEEEEVRRSQWNGGGGGSYMGSVSHVVVGGHQFKIPSLSPSPSKVPRRAQG